MSRYFEGVSQRIEEHGGTVEKFAGDAVMAAFAVPLVHEDDAERAVRAAFAVMESVHELELEARIGLEAGEVVVEDADSTFATGEAVNVAARLQQAASPGEIRLGPGARRLAAGAVEVEDAGNVERATVLSGRTLPYGEGVTYWPLASMVKASAGITDDDPANNAFEKLRLSCESEAVADLLAVALGVLGAAEGERTPQQLTWAALQWAEQVADAPPLVLVWGAETRSGSRT